MLPVFPRLWFLFLSLPALFLFYPKEGEAKHPAVCSSAPLPKDVPSPQHSIHRFLDHLLDSDTATTVLPFTRAGNLILIKARVDTTEGNFILDSGAPHLVLNVTYFRDYPATVLHDAYQTSITGNQPTVTRTTVRQLTLGGLEYYQLGADLVNLGHLENSKGVKILGLLGMELFKQCEMIIDYENNVIHLRRLRRKEAARFASAQLTDASRYHTFPIELIDNRIVVTTEMDGKKLKFLIDCAAESNVLDSRLPARILDNVTITRRVLLAGANSKKVEALYGDLKDLKLGDMSIGNLPVVVTNLENTCFSYMGCISGVLGFDFLSLQKIGFNFVTRKMYVWK